MTYKEKKRSAAARPLHKAGKIVYTEGQKKSRGIRHPTGSLRRKIFRKEGYSMILMDIVTFSAM